MKKVLITALLCSVSVFAAWDKFPVIEKGKGEAKFSWSTGSQGSQPTGESDGFYGIRYAPIADLEFAAFANDNYTLGARYQILSVLSAGVDVSFPLPGAFWSFTPNLQFSMDLIEKTLVLGSNFEVTFNTEAEYSYSETAETLAFKYKATQGIDAAAGIELDLVLNEKNTIWVSCDVEKGLTKSEAAGEELSRSAEGRGLGIYPALGYLITLGNLDLGTWVGLGFGKDAGNEELLTTVGIDASIKF